ncbi:TolC family protein [Botrimarina mediterranea]|nr:TolC family protein [Botrimarina mediterranea]
MLLVTAGCASGPRDFARGPQFSPPRGDSERVVTTAYQEEGDAQVEGDNVDLALPPSLEGDAAAAEELSAPAPLAEGEGLSLETLEQMSLSNNPAVSQSSARLRALRGKWVQAGLPPNPTAGYTAGEVGNDGRGGQQGGYVGQTFITAGKLKRDRAVVAAEITRAEQQLVATQRRVLTDTRHAYYQALLAQRRVELAMDLLQVSTDAADASKSLVDAEEIPVAGLLQTQIRQENSHVFLQTARNAQEQAWRRLSAVVGGPQLPQQDLEGDVTRLPTELNWQEQLARLQAESPEIASALAEMERARRALNRASVEAVPDISTQISVQYDAASEYTIAGVQVGMPIPLWNRNQGGIRQAQSEVTAAERNIQRVEQDLSQRLADAFRSYADAQVTTAKYSADILPRSQRTLDLVRKGYEQGEVGYLDLLAAQQTYSQANLAYLDALGELWQSYLLIDGLMLDGSLANAPL